LVRDHGRAPSRTCTLLREKRLQWVKAEQQLVGGFNELGDIELVRHEHIGGLAQQLAVQPHFSERRETVESEIEAFT
jgi:hypothetical protein